MNRPSATLKKRWPRRSKPTLSWLPRRPISARSRNSPRSCSKSTRKIISVRALTALSGKTSMTIRPITGILIGLTILQTLVIMIGWHGVRHGAWARSHAGRVLMSLLGVMWAILALATTSNFWPMFPDRSWIYLTPFEILQVALAVLGVTIIREQRKHNKE